MLCLISSHITNCELWPKTLSKKVFLSIQKHFSICLIGRRAGPTMQTQTQRFYFAVLMRTSREWTWSWAGDVVTANSRESEHRSVDKGFVLTSGLHSMINDKLAISRVKDPPSQAVQGELIGLSYRWVEVEAAARSRSTPPTFSWKAL